MLRGRLKETEGYLETWGTINALLEVWLEGEALVVKGECTDPVELHTWLLPSIANAYPDKEIYVGPTLYPENEAERERLKQRVRLRLEENSERMTRVTPSRQVD